VVLDDADLGILLRQVVQDAGRIAQLTFPYVSGADELLGLAEQLTRLQGIRAELVPAEGVVNPEVISVGLSASANR
jgi:hypothetical protein